MITRAPLFLCFVLAAACGKSSDEPGRGSRRERNAAPDCADAAGHLAMARPMAIGDKLPQLALAMSDACRADSWPDAVRTCLVAVHAQAAAASACIDQLDAAARASSVAAIEKAARDLGSTSPTW